MGMVFQSFNLFNNMNVMENCVLAPVTLKKCSRAEAEERARILVSDAEIVKAAQQRAAEITAAAQSESRTLRQTVTDYCDNMLKTTEEAMAENAAQVKNIRNSLRQNAKKNG